ncbi:MAG: hypothetical protein ABFS41_06055, partial [Myxococcota bacterium]
LQVQDVASDGGDRSQAMRLKGPPIETLTVDAVIDATDQLEFPGDNAGTVELLRSAIGDQPGMASAQNDLAFLLARRGESLPEATELAQEARANRPDSPQIADTLGYVYLRRDLDEAALVQFDAAAELSEPQSTSWATAQYHRGLALRSLGREEEAIVAIEQALASGAEFGQAQEAHQALVELARSREGAAGS